MMYYIEKPNTWSPANKKCKELQEFVGQFKNCLIADDLSLDALVEEIRHKVEELNQAYPRTKRLQLTRHNLYVSCGSGESLCESNYVFAFHVHPVHRTYRFSEQVPAPALTEGGER